jgi:alkaline phosphatase D
MVILLRNRKCCDIFPTWANDIPHPDSTYNGTTGRGSAAVEFVCTSVTSGSFITFTVSPSIITAIIPHIKYADLQKRGYLLLDVTNQKVQGDWVYMSTVASKAYTSTTGASWCNLDGANHMTPCGSALTARGTNPPIAPIISDVKNVKGNDMVMVSVFPNPWVNEIDIQYYIYQVADVTIDINEMSGKSVYHREIKHVQNGLFNAEVNLGGLAAGTYIVNIVSGGKTFSKQIVKAK